MAWLLMAALAAAEVDRLVEELANVPASQWSEAHRASAADASRYQGTGWTNCIQAQKQRYRSSREAVGDVATAVVTACDPEFQKYRFAIALSFRGLLGPVERDQKAAELMSNARQKMRDAVIGYLVESRLPGRR